MSPQSVAAGPLCQRPNRPPLPPPGSHSGSGPIQRRRALRACGRNGEGAAAQTVPAAQNALDAAPLSPCAEPSPAHGWIGLPVSATWRRIQRRLVALRARGALHARRGGAARRPRLGGPAARRHGALAVVRQPGRGLHLGRAALRERDALHAAPRLAAAAPHRLTLLSVRGGQEQPLAAAENCTMSVLVLVGMIRAHRVTLVTRVGRIRASQIAALFPPPPPN